VRRAFPASVWLIAAAQLFLHLWSNGRYGIFRDELYYLACADHLAWGYVDQPPLSIGLLALSRGLLGDSGVAIRLLPAFVGVGLILLAARLARRMGGGWFAQTLAALCVAAAPGILANTGFYSMNAWDLLLWGGIFLQLDRLLERGIETAPRREWLLFGALVGLGLLNKLSIVALILGLIVALPFTQLRRAWRVPGAWLAIGLAVLLFVPHVMWQIANEWPTREFIENAKRYKIADVSALGFMLQNTLDMLPNSAPVWIAGCIGTLAWPRLRERRWIGIVFLTVVVFFIAQQSKPYYLYTAFLPLFAAGAVVWEALSEGRRWRWLRPVFLLSIVLGWGLAAPMAIPVLSPEGLIAHQQRLGLQPSNAENSEAAQFSQHLADRFGWRELTAAVAEAYSDLTPEEQASCMIVGSNYGEAGAVTYFGPQYGLPPGTSTHNSFFLWGPTLLEPKVVLTVGMEIEDLEETFEEIELVGTWDAEFAMPYERNQPIYRCRGLKLPMMEAWERGRSFI